MSVTGSDVGFFQYGVLYNPKPVRNLGKAAQEITPEDINGHDVVIQLAGISNDPFGNLDPSKIYDPTRDYALQIAKHVKKWVFVIFFPQVVLFMESENYFRRRWSGQSTNSIFFKQSTN